MNLQNRDRLIFERLKREGECWHEWEDSLPKEYRGYPKCKKCGLVYGLHDKSISYAFHRFDGWKGFGWAWERAQEKEWWGKFLFSIGVRQFQSGPGNKEYGYIFTGHIHPTRFFNALWEFLEIENK